MSQALSWSSERWAHALRRLYEVLELDTSRLRVASSREPSSGLAEAVAQTDRTVDPVTLSYEAIDDFVRRGGPALIELRGGGVVVMLAGGRRRARVLEADGRVVGVSPTRLARILRQPVAEQMRPRLDSLLGEQGGTGRKRERARSRLLGLLMAEQPTCRAWLLRVPPHAPLRDQLRSAAIPRQAGIFAAGSVINRLVQSAGWAWIISAALTDRLDEASVGIWAALLLSSALLGAFVVRVVASLSIDLGALVRRRLMWGALRVDLDEGRSRGIGQILGLVLEGTSMETAAIQSALTVSLAAVEALALLLVLLVTGQGLLAVAFLGFVALLLRQGRRLHRARSRWTDERLAMTHDFIEKLLGHRTRRTQGDPRDERDEGERQLERYHRASEAADARLPAMWGVLAPAWTLVGAAVVTGAVAFGGAPRSELALGIGLVLYGASILRQGGQRFAQLIDRLIGLRLVLPLWRAGANRPRPGLPGVRVDDEAPGSGALLEARNVSFAYGQFAYGQGRRLLDDVSLTVRADERVLLLGASGSGKSTFVDLVTGLREPRGGVLRLWGVDSATLGAWRWRHRVLAIHQFQTNHVFSETMAFNLLLGRGWPPTDEDLQRAEAVCEALGLGPLLRRMPAGIMQHVGEGGWALSHGERTRLFLARALLQEPWVMVLDETLSALDPMTLRQVAVALGRYEGAVLAVAHP